MTGVQTCALPISQHLSEALEALSPSVGGDGGELRKEQAHLGLCERAEGKQGEQKRVDAFALGGCEGVLEVLP